MTNKFSDQSKPVRAGEELDVAKLGAYLRKHLPNLEGDEIQVEQFPSGFSNLTYLIRLGADECVLRRAPAGAQVKSGHDMAREFRVLSNLRTVYEKVPRALVYCDDEAVIGAPFYLMERVKGIIIRSRLPEGMVLDPESVIGLTEAFVNNLAEIHAVDYQACGLGELGQPEGYVRRQVEGWTKRYAAARTDNVPSMERAAVWLAASQPRESGAALVHNDYKFDNVVLDPEDLSRIVAVLDWEMATLGDPLMDFGSALGYWIDADDPDEWQHASMGLTRLPGQVSRNEMAHLYAQASGRDLSGLVFYYAFALFKTGVIVQQIYKRYRLGFTQDERFAGLDTVVRACGQMAMLAIEKQRIDGLG
jgi:aminoglycoside phosphotransferase (APT) family kinase protein